MMKEFLISYLIFASCLFGIDYLKQESETEIYDDVEKETLQNFIWNSGQQCDEILIAVKFENSVDVSCDNHGLVKNYSFIIGVNI